MVVATLANLKQLIINLSKDALLKAARFLCRCVFALSFTA
jgi:hypothetical protein